MARSIDRRLISAVPAQRGISLLESLIAIVLLSMVGLGITYTLSRAASTQRQISLQQLTILALRAHLQQAGAAADCAPSGTQVTDVSVILANGQATTAHKQCTMTSVAVSVNGVTKPAIVPIVRLEVESVGAPSLPALVIAN